MAKDEIDQLAQFIREVDGDHTLGAGELAKKIITELTPQEVLAQQIADSFPSGDDHVHWAPGGGMSTEYGVQVAGYPTAIAGWRDWAEEPVNNMEWFSDRDERDEYGDNREDEGYEVEYFTRMITSPVKDEMEHIQ